MSKDFHEFMERLDGYMDLHAPRCPNVRAKIKLAFITLGVQREMARLPAFDPLKPPAC